MPAWRLYSATAWKRGLYCANILERFSKLLTARRQRQPEARGDLRGLFRRELAQFERKTADTRESKVEDIIVTLALARLLLECLLELPHFGARRLRRRKKAE